MDRNFDVSLNYKEVFPSLSARRAWIEIHGARPIGCKCLVALRKESVDRNNGRIGTIHNAKMSLSARRAWIEMRKVLKKETGPIVALRKESVDRNTDGVVSGSGDYGRSPQGERG